MTKRLEELFDLTDDTPEEKTDIPVAEEPLDQSIISVETLETIEKVELALPQVRGLESSDQEMDDLADMAKTAFNNLMDLGMQVESRFSAEIFNSAGTMLGHAITAKTAKLNKKLKTIDLQLKKVDLERKLAAQKPNGQGEGSSTHLGQGQTVDRNELIRAILNEANLNKQQKDK